jgi:hypothetical protein
MRIVRPFAVFLAQALLFRKQALRIAFRAVVKSIKEGYGTDANILLVDDDAQSSTS